MYKISFQICKLVDRINLVDSSSTILLLLTLREIQLSSQVAANGNVCSVKVNVTLEKFVVEVSLPANLMWQCPPRQFLYGENPKINVLNCSPNAIVLYAMIMKFHPQTSRIQGRLAVKECVTMCFMSICVSSSLSCIMRKRLLTLT